jgi:hypothetical protein
MSTIDEFAAQFEAERRMKLARDYPNIDLTTDTPLTSGNGFHNRVKVTPGPKYTKVDFDGSGKYMIDNATGIIYGIKGYGVVHKGHTYGTLATIDEWYWGGYTAIPRHHAH